MAFVNAYTVHPYCALVKKMQWSTGFQLMYKHGKHV